MHGAQLVQADGSTFGTKEWAAGSSGSTFGMTEWHVGSDGLTFGSNGSTFGSNERSATAGFAARGRRR